MRRQMTPMQCTQVLFLQLLQQQGQQQGESSTNMGRRSPPDASCSNSSRCIVRVQGSTALTPAAALTATAAAAAVSVTSPYLCVTATAAGAYGLLARR
jgi:hypothetical protein